MSVGINCILICLCVFIQFKVLLFSMFVDVSAFCFQTVGACSGSTCCEVFVCFVFVCCPRTTLTKQLSSFTFLALPPAPTTLPVLSLPHPFTALPISVRVLSVHRNRMAY